MEFIQKPDIRERVLERGLLYPTDEELIMLILGSGTRQESVEELAVKVVKAIDSSSIEKLVPTLLKINGVGKGRALAIAAAIELGRRRTCHLEARILHPSDIIPYVKNYAIKPQEHFITICLSGAHEILNIDVSSVGTVNRTVVHPREIFTEAIKQKASAIVVCHNHPSGNCNPSKEDIETTNRLVQASEILGITLLDHIIINKTSYFSFVENNILKRNSC
ncbi:RadC family protein [Treponema sp.]|uniref:RadC family protein n=1 Tax=Treponema sp. TaxID=166 RepID=UPI00298E3EE6|nr:DNA repair protein RadC [Treponema sp.]MCR5613481.1 DNA repair protein RadC [Treponema sp.]